MVSETSPAIGAIAVTPSDSADITGGPCRALYVGVTGNISVTFQNGQTAFFENVPVGWFPVCAKRVNATTGGTTTATKIIAML